MQPGRSSAPERGAGVCRGSRNGLCCPCTWHASTHLCTVHLPTHRERNAAARKSSRATVLSDQGIAPLFRRPAYHLALNLPRAGGRILQGLTWLLFSPSPPPGLSCWAWSLITCANMTMLRSATGTAATARSSSVSVAMSGQLPSEARAPHSTSSSTQMAPRTSTASMPSLRRSQVKARERKAKFYFILAFIFWPCPTACGILVPRPGIESTPPAVETRIHNHWTSREVPKCHFLWLRSR